MDKMILTDKTEITIKEGASLNAITAVVEQFKDLDPIASAILKEGNLDAVQFKSEENITGNYTDMRLEYPLFQVNVVKKWRQHSQSVKKQRKKRD